MTCTDGNDEDGGEGDGFGDGYGAGSSEPWSAWAWDNGDYVPGHGAGHAPGQGSGGAEGGGCGHCSGELLSGGGEDCARCRAHGRGFGAGTGVGSGSCTWLGAVDLT